MSGGRVTGGKRVDDRRDLFEMTVEPDGGGDVTITLPAGRACGVSGAICTKGDNRRQLTNTPAATVAGPSDDAPEPNTAASGAPTISGTPQVGEELTALTSGIADADGLDNAGFAYQWIRTDTDIQGATGSTYTAVDADEGKRLKVRVSFTDDAGNEESLASAATDAVVPEPEPLTASFEDVPAAHDGESAFTLRIASSDRLSMMNGRRLREDVVAVSGGRATSAGRVDRRRDLWELTVEPDSLADVTVTLAAGAACGTPAAVCTKDGRALSNTISATVRGPVGISVADARVEEAEGALLAFAVTLSRAASESLTVDYATADGSAHAGDDYTVASGTLTFRAGESSQTIEVGVLDDAHDEGEETLRLRLSNPSGGRLADGEATGTIANHDSMPRALLARFGRTAAVHVVEHVEERLAAPREPGFRGRFAGRELRRGMERDVAPNVLRQLGGAAGAGPMGAGVHGPLSGAPATGAAPLGMTGLASGGGHSAAARADGHGDRSDGRRVRAGRRARPGQTAADGPRRWRHADRLGLRAGPPDPPRRHPLVLEPRVAVALLRPRGRAVARRRRADDDGRGRLREGAAGDGPVAVAQPGPGRIRRGRRRPGGLVRDGPVPVAGLQGDRPHHGVGPVDGDGGGRDAGRAGGRGRRAASRWHSRPTRCGSARRPTASTARRGACRRPRRR